MNLPSFDKEVIFYYVIFYIRLFFITTFLGINLVQVCYASMNQVMCYIFPLRGDRMFQEKYCLSE